MHNVLHLLVGQLAEARGEYHAIRRVERLEAGDVVERQRIDLAGLGVYGEERHGIEPVMGGE